MPIFKIPKLESMKKAIVLALLLLPIAGFSQNSGYSVVSYLEAGMKAPNTHYIGEAWLNGLLPADAGLDYHITKATFRANSTLDWHRHTAPQVLIIVSGQGYYQERGKDPVIMKVGDVITCSKETEHWHASSKDRDVTYLAVYSGETIWTEVLTQEAYDAVAEKLKTN